MQTKLTLMKLLCILFITIISTTQSIAQNQVSKDEFVSVLQETLTKARNAVPTAENSWSYDNTNQDYFKKDTITLNTARVYKRNYCKEIRWSFNENQKLVLQNTPECTEPPTMLKPKKEDYLTLECIKKNDKLYLILKNHKGVREIFRVLELIKNKPIILGDSAFDYTLKLIREK